MRAILGALLRTYGDASAAAAFDAVGGGCSSSSTAAGGGGATGRAAAGGGKERVAQAVVDGEALRRVQRQPLLQQIREPADELRVVRSRLQQSDQQSEQ